MIDKFSLTFAIVNVSISFIRLFFIKENFSSEVFRNYTLTIIPILYIVELENIKYDLSRKKNGSDNNSINYFIMSALFIIIIILINELKLIRINDLYLIILTTVALMDGLINVNTASRNKITNIIILLARIMSISLLYWENIYYYFFSVLINIWPIRNEIRINNIFKISILKIKLNVSAYLIATGGRFKEWNITYFTQKIIENGDLYFSYYIFSRILQNLSGLIYMYFRSSLRINTSLLYSISNKYYKIILLIPIIIYITNVKYCIIILPLLAFFENIVAQFMLYSNNINTSKNLIINNVGCAIFLSILYINKLNENIIILYISISYIIGIICLFYNTEKNKLSIK